MEGLIDEQMDRWNNWGMDGWMDRHCQRDKLMDQIDGKLVGGWANKQMKIWVENQTDRSMDGWIDG